MRLKSWGVHSIPKSVLVKNIISNIYLIKIPEQSTQNKEKVTGLVTERNKPVMNPQRSPNLQGRPEAELQLPAVRLPLVHRNRLQPLGHAGGIICPNEMTMFWLHAAWNPTRLLVIQNPSLEGKR